MVRTTSRLPMTDSEREEQKKIIKEGLSREKSNAKDADSSLGEPYVTDNRTEDEMLTEECQQEMIPIYTGRKVKLEEIVTSIERLSIPHMNSTGQLKLQSNRFIENFEPDPTAPAAGCKAMGHSIEAASNPGKHPTCSKIGRHQITR